MVNFVLPEMTLSRLIWVQMHDTLAKVMEARERLSVESLSPRSQEEGRVHNKYREEEV